MAGRPTAGRWRGGRASLTAVAERIGRHFARSEPRQRAVGYVRGLLGDAERKNGWQLAEDLGDADPGRGAAPAGPGRLGRRRGAGRPGRLRRATPRARRAACWSWTRPGS